MAELDPFAQWSQAKFQAVLQQRVAQAQQLRSAKLPMNDLQAASSNSKFGMIVVTTNPIANLIQWVLSGGLLGGLFGAAAKGSATEKATKES